MKPVTSQAFQRVDAHAAEHVLQLQAPAAQQIGQPSGADIRVNPLGEEEVAGADAPGTLPGVALLAEAAAQGNKSGGADVDGVSTEGNRLG